MSRGAGAFSICHLGSGIVEQADSYHATLAPETPAVGLAIGIKTVLFTPTDGDEPGVTDFRLVVKLDQTFSQKDQIRAALRGPEQQRKEPRTPRRVALELSGSDKPLIYEITITENVSRHGARVVT